MRLTKRYKEEFVDAAMSDIPCIDYRGQAEKMLIADAVSRMPLELGALYEKHSEYFNHLRIWTLFGGIGAAFKITVSTVTGYTRSPELLQEYKELGLLADAQRLELNQIRSGLDAIMKKCPTLDHALQHLPEELHKYLPARRATAARARIGKVNPNDQLVDFHNVLNAMKSRGWTATSREYGPSIKELIDAKHLADAKGGE